MAKSNKLQQLLDQKAKIEEQLRIEKEKHYMLIGKIAVKYDLHLWGRSEIENLFKEAVNNGSSHYTESKEQKEQVENNQQQENQDSESPSYDHNGTYKSHTAQS
jgi:hypothetical protein